MLAHFNTFACLCIHFPFVYWVPLFMGKGPYLCWQVAKSTKSGATVWGPNFSTTKYPKVPQSTQKYLKVPKSTSKYPKTKNLKWISFYDEKGKWSFCIKQIRTKLILCTFSLSRCSRQYRQHPWARLPPPPARRLMDHFHRLLCRHSSQYDRQLSISYCLLVPRQAIIWLLRPLRLRLTWTCASVP